jgi:hypothetical protein
MGDNTGDVMMRIWMVAYDALVIPAYQLLVIVEYGVECRKKLKTPTIPKYYSCTASHHSLFKPSFPAFLPLPLVPYHPTAC